MFSTRVFFSGRLYLTSRFFSKAAVLNNKNTFIVNTQVDYLRSSIKDSGDNDWLDLKNDILSKQGSVNQKNVNGVMLKIMISNKKFEAAQSFVNHLKSSKEELTLGTINGILALYFEFGKERALLNEERYFILENYKTLYEKYKILDSTTCERLLHALCVINEWTKALKVLDDICLSSTPSHSAYSILIATLFKNNKKKEALSLIERSLSSRRPLQKCVYEEWINFSLRKYKNNNVIIEHLHDICLHISNNCTIITGEIAAKLEETFNKLGCNVQYTKILKQNGQCVCCSETLECLELNDEEFQILEQNVKNKLIVGSDLFLKTSPNELQRFLKFVEKTAPYDIVLDSLNIAYGSGKGTLVDKLNILKNVVDYFSKKNKKILLLGRKHMLKWPKQRMEYLQEKAYSFFTDDLTQDDPYFITATILSGSHTDFMTKDLLRGHIFLLKNKQLRQIFQRWQWQHQWMVFSRKHGAPYIQPPLKFTPFGQKNNQIWHLPYEAEDSSSEIVNDGTPNLNSWLCIKPKDS